MKLFLVLFFALFSFVLPASGLPVKTTHKSVAAYETSDDALSALKEAIASEDPKELVKLFGSQSRSFLMTGDEIADKAMMRRMARRFSERAELIQHVNPEYPSEQWFKVRFGKEGWDMYIPLVNRGHGWLFATEIALYSAKRTRIAMNEIAAIDTLLAVRKAQHEYYSKDLNNNSVKDYAQKIISTPGERDGLYWQAEDYGLESPLHGLVARAIEDGYTSSRGKDPKYEGYVYRILTGQGRKARGGERSYLKDGKLVGGLALLAYPVKWNASGMHTFMIDNNGQIWKKDLGSRTSKQASSMSKINNDYTWYRVEYSTVGEHRTRKNW